MRKARRKRRWLRQFQQHQANQQPCDVTYVSPNETKMTRRRTRARVTRGGSVEIISKVERNSSSAVRSIAWLGLLVHADTKELGNTVIHLLHYARRSGRIG